MRYIYEYSNSEDYDLDIAIKEEQKVFEVAVCDTYTCKKIAVPISELDRLIAALQKARTEME